MRGCVCVCLSPPPLLSFITLPMALAHRKVCFLILFFACMSEFVRACLCARMRVCMCLCVCVFVCLCVFVCGKGVSNPGAAFIWTLAPLFECVLACMLFACVRVCMCLCLSLDHWLRLLVCIVHFLSALLPKCDFISELLIIA